MNISRLKRIERKLPVIDYSQPVKLEIGSGPDESRTSQGYIGIDILDRGQPIIWDIEQGLPFPNSSISEIFCKHVLEHLEDPLGLLNEFHRVLNKDGFAHIIVPHIDHPAAFEFTHTHFFREETFKYLARGELMDLYGTKPWQITNIIVNERKDLHVTMRPDHG